MNLDEFKKELRPLINRHSLDNDCNTPDFVLADYLTDCLHAYYASMVRSGRVGHLPEKPPVVELTRDLYKLQRKINRMRDETVKRGGGEPTDCGCYKCQDERIISSLHLKQE